MDGRESTSIIEFDDVSFVYPGEPGPVFGGLSISIPAGVTSLAGPNGVGKSTFLLLAGARLFPTAGQVRVLGQDAAQFINAGVDPARETQRNRLVSFVYQNMEFESEQPVGELLEFVQAAGAWEQGTAQGDAFRTEMVSLLELTPELCKRTGELSKGAMQRAVVAFSLLYGSRLILLDEPVFALEDRQKEAVFELVVDTARRHGRSVLYSAHELDLTRRYSDRLLLFAKDGTLRFGPTEEVLTREHLEHAYQVPYELLHRKEQLYREMLRGEAELTPRPGEAGGSTAGSGGV